MKKSRTFWVVVEVVFAVYSESLMANQAGSDGTFTTIVQGVEQFKDPNEALPAENDLDGNWGAKLEGLQLSIRLQKTTFELGEPNTVTVLFRNSTSNAMTMAGSGSWKSLHFVVVDEHKELVPSTLTTAVIRGTAGGGIQSIELPSNSQFKYQLRLDKECVLDRPGSYVAYVKRRVFLNPQTDLGEIVSGNCLFTIVALPEKYAGKWPKTESELLENRLARGDIEGAVAISKKATPSATGQKNTPVPDSQRRLLAVSTANPTSTHLMVPASTTNSSINVVGVAPSSNPRNWLFGSIVVGVLAGMGLLLWKRSRPG